MSKASKEVMAKVIVWFGGGCTGISSECMAIYLTTGVTPSRASTPSDPSDFNRCLKLIRDVPELKPIISKMSKVSPKWAELVKNWDKLESCFINEVGEFWALEDKSATITYKAMKGMGL